jgi:hypothetical protein
VSGQDARSAAQGHGRRFVRTSRKLYLRIPGGEVQWGRISHRLTVWFRGRRLI